MLQINSFRTFFLPRMEEYQRRRYLLLPMILQRINRHLKLIMMRTGDQRWTHSFISFNLFIVRELSNQFFLSSYSFIVCERSVSLFFYFIRSLFVKNPFHQFFYCSIEMIDLCISDVKYMITAICNSKRSNYVQDYA